MREWDRETLVFRAATAFALLHAVDDAFLNRQPGVPASQHALAAAVAVIVGLAAALAFPRLRPGLRSGTALAFGLFAIVNGALHLVHIAKDGPADSDVTGVLALAAGVSLMLLGLAIPFVHRGEGAATRRRRWAHRLVALVIGFVVVYALVYPTSIAIVVTHKYREPIGAPPSSAYQEVTFESTDGLELSGWYVPSTNRAAVVVVHGGGGDRMGTLRATRAIRTTTGSTGSPERRHSRPAAAACCPCA